MAESKDDFSIVSHFEWNTYCSDSEYSIVDNLFRTFGIITKKFDSVDHRIWRRIAYNDIFRLNIGRNPCECAGIKSMINIAIL